MFIETFDKGEMQLILNVVVCSKGRNALKLQWLNCSLCLKASIMLWCLCKLHVCDLQLADVEKASEGINTPSEHLYISFSNE